MSSPEICAHCGEAVVVCRGPRGMLLRHTFALVENVWTPGCWWHIHKEEPAPTIRINFFDKLPVLLHKRWDQNASIITSEAPADTREFLISFMLLQNFREASLIDSNPEAKDGISSRPGCRSGLAAVVSLECGNLTSHVWVSGVENSVVDGCTADGQVIA